MLRLSKPLIMKNYYSTKINLANLPILNNSINFLKKSDKGLNKVAVINEDNSEFNFIQLFSSTFKYSNLLKETEKVSDLKEKRIAYLIPPSFSNVAVLWGIWSAGGIAVPLCTSHPTPELEHFILDSKSSTIITTLEYLPRLKDLIEKYQLNQILLNEKENLIKDEIKFDNLKFDEILNLDRRALIIYTSGTTGKPKGVVTTHKNITAQLEGLTEAWKYNINDKILNPLPLHHVHGLINATHAVLFNGGTVEFLNKFQVSKIFNRFMDLRRDLTLFMAVPTIYAKLLNHYSTLSSTEQSQFKNSLNQFRLLVSGSSALPKPIANQFNLIANTKLLERYGMTEIGMALTNSYINLNERVEGEVGKEFPNVEIRLIDLTDNKIINEIDIQGEIQVKGPNVFKEYWNKPIETKDTFTNDGWFKTGDTGIRTDRGTYKIMGRTSVDILKVSGYKISALEIEKELLNLSTISECAVLGLPDQEFGQKIVALVVLDRNVDPTTFDQKRINLQLSKVLAPYKLPKQYIFVEEIEKNVIGKINKKKLILKYI